MSIARSNQCGVAVSSAFINSSLVYDNHAIYITLDRLEQSYKVPNSNYSQPTNVVAENEDDVMNASRVTRASVFRFSSDGVDERKITILHLSF
jgi:hypothetical protein